jgi:predicted phosphodiesterase
MRPLAIAVLALALPSCSTLKNAVQDSGPEPPSGPPPAAAPGAPAASALDIRLPRTADGFRFAVIGDSGSGSRGQMQTAAMLTRYHQELGFKHVLMLGDNIYEPDTPADYRKKFEVPYAALLGAGVKFYAALGNHDSRNQTHYAHFNMGGERFYSFKPVNGVRFFALDSNYLDPPQLEWLRKELEASASDWKVVYMHHPLYSSGDKHGPDEEKRTVLEPLLKQHGVTLVLQGHEHFYERLKPQAEIHYITNGGAGKLRPGSNVSALTAKGFDDDHTFMVLEIVGDDLHFQTVSRTGKTIDSGVIRRRGATTGTQAAK